MKIWESSSNISEAVTQKISMTCSVVPQCMEKKNNFLKLQENKFQLNVKKTS